MLFISQLFVRGFLSNLLGEKNMDIELFGREKIMKLLINWTNFLSQPKFRKRRGWKMNKHTNFLILTCVYI